ncbi:hypothetical protein [Natronoglomus mannanivorans]|uniref:Uncharacterized protein n=1 Tax=Natronoglomus mannanivorans TaxID=2979990 RepID=A0AAP2Z417_9EURY|nr:hypothetical protein [Halobacteria archaeon AArc-xg1-1]
MDFPAIAVIEMAVTDSPADGEEAQSSSSELNSMHYKAIREGISQQASQQVDFQMAVRVKGDPSEDEAAQFHEDLMKFIEGQLEADNIGMAEIAIALWNEVNRMEEQVREASKEIEQNESTDVESGHSGGASSEQNSAASDEETLVESEANSGIPNDPAFY